MRLTGGTMLPSREAEPPACGTGVPTNGCENLLYTKITVASFYRGGRTEISQVVEGQIPVAPGSSVLLSQRAHPPWPTGCYSLRYRLANNGNNHDQIKIEWFVDNEPLDAIHYGSCPRLGIASGSSRSRGAWRCVWATTRRSWRRSPRGSRWR